MNLHFSRERAVLILLSISAATSDVQQVKTGYLKKFIDKLLSDIYPPKIRHVFNKSIIIRYISAIIIQKKWQKVKILWNQSLSILSTEPSHIKYKLLQSVILIFLASGELSMTEQRTLKLLFKDLKVDRAKFNKFLKYQNHIVVEDKFTFKQKLPIIQKKEKFTAGLKQMFFSVVGFVFLILVSYCVVSSKFHFKEVLSAASEQEKQWSYYSKGIYSDDALCIEPLKRFSIKPELLSNPSAFKGNFRSEYLDLQNRYIVADMEVQDRNGVCKGVKEIFPQGYVEKYKKLKPVIIESNPKVCRGQTLSLCLLEGNVIRLVARLALSSGSFQKTYKDYYSPIMYIRTRNGDGRKVADKERDLLFSQNVIGSSSEKLLKYNRKIPMPNFMQIVPIPPMKAETQNGIHRYPYLKDKFLLGKPASQGCLRTSDLGTRFIRDWTPLGAKVFILHPTVSHPITDL
jgi:hypothetical protein